MTKQYVAKNGKVFETEDACLAYEAELEAEEQRKIKLKEEKDARIKLIQNMYDTLMKEVENYNKDYGTAVTLNGKGWDDLDLMFKYINRIFG